jgi:predicted lactoylglutathione lyase
MDLGEYYPCLNVRDLAASIEFYQQLDFTMIEDHRHENWAVLQHNNMVLCLFQGHIEQNLINFRGGDVEEIYQEAVRRGLQFTKPAHRESDGSWSAEVRDPDGNCIYFNTFPEERERYLRNGKLIDY